MHGSRLRPCVLPVVAVLITLAVAPAVPAPAMAGNRACGSQTATIVGTARGETIVGTPEADVIVAQRLGFIEATSQPRCAPVTPSGPPALVVDAVRA